MGEEEREAQSQDWDVVNEACINLDVLKKSAPAVAVVRYTTDYCTLDFTLALGPQSGCHHCLIMTQISRVS